MRFRQVPWETGVDHFTLCGEGAPVDGPFWLHAETFLRFRPFQGTPSSSCFNGLWNAGPLWSHTAWLAVSHNRPKDASVVAGGVAHFSYFGRGTNACGQSSRLPVVRYHMSQYEVLSHAISNVKAGTRDSFLVQSIRSANSPFSDSRPSQLTFANVIRFWSFCLGPPPAM